MKAAIYCRYSTDRQTESSTRDQIRVCTEWAKRSGISVGDVYKDEGISGAATENRPGLQRMLEAASRREFGVLLVMDVSRLSRHQADTFDLAERLTFHGVRVVGVQDGADTSKEGWEVMFGFAGIMGQQFRKMIAKKTYAALESRATTDRPTGGRSYGYTKEGTIDPEQAKVVRQIFAMYAEGHSSLAIAAELNRKGVPSPGSTWKREQRRKCKWLASAIGGDPKRGIGILNNEKYHGIFIWNRSHWERIPKKGTKRSMPRPEGEWIRRPRPDLRIVDEALWKQVKARQQLQAANLGQAVKAGLKKSMRHSGRNGKWLLSGLLKCGDCGSNLVMQDQTHYICSTYRNGGKAACSNGLRVSREVAEVRLLAGVKEQLLAPDNIKRLQSLVREALSKSRQNAKGDLEVVDQRLKKVEGEIANLVKAIKAGIFTTSTKEELQSCEAERERLRDTLAQGGASPKVVALIPKLPERFRAMVEDLGTRAKRASPRDNARAQATLFQLLGAVRVESELVGGVRVPVAVLQGKSRAILSAVGAGPSALENCGSGGRI